MAAGPYNTQTHVNALWGETVTVTSVRPNSSDVAEAVTAARYTRGTRQRQASYGVYTAADEVFTVATDALTFTPKPRDTVTRSGTVNTVLAVDGSPWLKFWVLTTVNLALAADLRSTGTLTRPPLTQDAAGRRQFNGYSTVASGVPCRVQSRESLAADFLQRRAIAGSHVAFLGQNLTVRAQDTFVVGSVYYTVLGYRDAESIEDLMSLDLEALP